MSVFSSGGKNGGGPAARSESTLGACKEVSGVTGCTGGCWGPVGVAGKLRHSRSPDRVVIGGGV